jgi:hypothetical protein
MVTTGAPRQVLVWFMNFLTVFFISTLLLDYGKTPQR